MATVPQRGIAPRLREGFGLAALLLVLLGAATWWNTSRLVDAALWVEHSREVITDLDSLFLALKDAESGQRGYIITGLPSYLEPYNSAEASLGLTLSRLRKLVADNRDQKGNLQELESLVSQRRAILKEGIDLFDQSGIEAAAANIVSGTGKAKMETIRLVIERMRSHEIRLLRERSTSTASLARAAIITLSLGGLLLFASLAVIWYLLRHDLLHRHAAEERLAAIVASSQDAIVAEDLSGNVTAWNAAAEQLFGYTAEEMIGRSTALLEPPELVGNTERTLARIRSGERVLQFDTRRRRKDGTTVPVSVSVSPIRDAGGEIIGASKIARNITERKQAEDLLLDAKESAEAANRAKDSFLAILSHELRTPLTPALATAQLLERKAGLPEEVTKAVQLIRRNIELEAVLVDDLLDLTRIAHGKLELKREPLDLHALVEGVSQICRSEILTRRQRLTLDLQAPEHFAEADSARLQQVLWNLLRNASKFTGEGGAIQVLTDNPAPGTIRIRVRDTGIGIAPALLERVFEPFEQGAARRRYRQGGLGLGLSISRAFIGLHGGSIRAESAGEGKGATFTIEMPAHLEKRLASAARVSRDVRVGEKSLQILIVEDHADTATALQQLLASEGHEVHPAATMAEAVSLFRKHSIDLLITDLGLPDGSGHELIGMLRRVRPVEGIVLSGYGMDSDVELSRAAGFSEHLTKPVNVRKLLHVIGRLAGDS